MVYGKQGEGTATSVMSQIRALVSEMRADAYVQLITDESLMRMNGIEETPAVFVDGVVVSNGWSPSRTEMQRALQHRIEALSFRPDADDF